MFPTKANDPYIDKTGKRSTIGDAISAGGGGSPYILPTASTSTKGGVKIGEGLSMSGEVLNNTNPTPYSLPTASSNTKGGVKIGNGLSVSDDVLSANSQLPAHTSSEEGKFLGVDSNGDLEWSTPSGSGVEYRAGVTSRINLSANNSFYAPVTFSTPMSNDQYAVSVTINRATQVTPSISISLPPLVISNKTANGFWINGYNNSDAAVNSVAFEWVAIPNK